VYNQTIVGLATVIMGSTARQTK